MRSDAGSSCCPIVWRRPRPYSSAPMNSAICSFTRASAIPSSRSAPASSCPDTSGKPTSSPSSCLPAGNVRRRESSSNRFCGAAAFPQAWTSISGSGDFNDKEEHRSKTANRAKRPCLPSCFLAPLLPCFLVLLLYCSLALLLSCSPPFQATHQRVSKRTKKTPLAAQRPVPLGRPSRPLEAFRSIVSFLTSGCSARSSRVRNPVDAAAPAGEHVLCALDLDPFAEHAADHARLIAAQADAGRGGVADGTVLLRERIRSVRLPFVFGHVALGRAGFGQTPQLLLKRGLRSVLAGRQGVDSDLLAVADGKQLLQPLLAECFADGIHKSDGQLRVSRREEPVGFRRQAPQLGRAPHRAGLLLERDQRLILQSVQMLAHGHAGDAKHACQRAGVQRPVLLEQVDDRSAGAGGARAFLLVVGR
ncbi:hypothetical protein BN871_GN_00120 [Paenibacillus sp. P22]|nr:hypothetical protein BN871_GN_00120 [Paenibacillus sp. P22]